MFNCSTPARFVLGFAWLLTSCNLSRTIASEGEPSTPATSGSARLIAAKGTIFRLGSDDPQAAPEERPGWTRFAHDFWMDTTEVTQKEFAALVGRNPSPTRGDNLPVANVTWYDAVLAANARSKRDGLDTVYRYLESKVNPDGSVWDLAGLSADLTRGGWRLPTEAEWELAARAGSNSPYPWGTIADSAKARQYAWLQTNSGSIPQQVGILAANAWGLHDMAGNVMEWVQDWKGPFPKDTIPEFAGQASPGEVADVPVKGGASKFGITYLRPSNRSSTYASGRNARTEYVGFRLARGSFSPSYTDQSGAALQIPAVSLSVSNLATRLSVRGARLVFLNRTNGKGTLSWVDYGETNPVVRYLSDSFPVFHPVISPDGKWVAWSTALEGSSTPSRIRARRLSSSPTTAIDLGTGAIPRWWVNGTDTFLIRADAMDNLSNAWPAGKTTMRRWSAGSLEPSEQILAQGSFHDGRSGHFLYSGYRRLIQHDLSKADSRILFTAPENGKAAGDTSQVCNVSSAPDGSGRVMFLDFGFAGNSSIVGRPYGIHEIAFVADSNGRIVQNLPAPSGELQWDHLEWSNASRWAVASVQNGAGANHAIHLLDLQSGTNTLLASGEDLWQPALWVGNSAQTTPPGNVDLDSAGDWNNPTNLSAEEFGIKTRSFWNVRNRLDVVFLGSSHVKSGLDPASITNGTAFNWGVVGGEIKGARKILEQYLLPSAPRLKVVVLEIMPGWMFAAREVAWAPISSTVGYQYDLNHGFWQGNPPQAFLEAIGSRNFPTSVYFDSLGGRYTEGGSWGPDIPSVFPPGQESFSSEPFLSNWEDLVASIELLERAGIRVILVNFPQSPQYRSMPWMGRHGPSWETWKELSRRLVELEGKHTKVVYYDAYLNGNHDFLPSEFIDEDHLDHLGAKKLTHRIDSIITTFLHPVVRR